MHAVASNFQVLPAPVAILALLGAGGLFALLAAGAVFAGLRGRATAALRLLGGAAAVPLLYGGALLAFGVTSRETTLAPGGEKFFCEIDCHIGYSISSIRPGEAAGGRRLLGVRLRTRFDETTIASFRGNAPLWPNPRRIELLDAQGRRFPLANGASALAALEKPLRPGEAYETELLFDVPADASGLKLSIVESDWPTKLLLGHENAPLHARATLALPG